MFSKNKDIQDLLLKENKRLKIENDSLRSVINNLQKHKEEYEVLIQELHNLKNEYKNKMKLFNEIEIEYKKELDKLINK